MPLLPFSVPHFSLASPLSQSPFTPFSTRLLAALTIFGSRFSAAAQPNAPAFAKGADSSWVSPPGGYNNAAGPRSVALGAPTELAAGVYAVQRP